MLAPHPKLRMVSPYQETSVSVDLLLASYSSGSLGSYISGLGPAVGLAVAAAIVEVGKIIALDKLVR